MASGPPLGPAESVATAALRLRQGPVARGATPVLTLRQKIRRLFLQFKSSCRKSLRSSCIQRPCTRTSTLPGRPATYYIRLCSYASSSTPSGLRRVRTHTITLQIKVLRYSSTAFHSRMLLQLSCRLPPLATSGKLSAASQARAHQHER